MNYPYFISKKIPEKDLGSWEREAVRELSSQGMPVFALKLRLYLIFRAKVVSTRQRLRTELLMRDFLVSNKFVADESWIEDLESQFTGKKPLKGEPAIEIMIETL